MAGDSLSTPLPLGADTTGATELDALRTRLAAAELGLSQTQTALSSARLTIAENDAAAASAPPSAIDAARPPTGVGGGGGAAPDVGTAAPDATVGRTGEGGADPGVAAADGGNIISAARDGADVGGVTVFGEDPYVAAVGDDADGEEDGTDWGGGRRGRHAGARRGGRFPSRADALDEAGAYNAVFAFRTRLGPEDWLQAFDDPRAVLRDDGLPVPFTPADPVHTTTFTAGSRDESETRLWYCALA